MISETEPVATGEVPGGADRGVLPLTPKSAVFAVPCIRGSVFTGWTRTSLGSLGGVAGFSATARLSMGLADRGAGLRDDSLPGLGAWVRVGGRSGGRTGEAAAYRAALMRFQAACMYRSPWTV